MSVLVQIKLTKHQHNKQLLNCKHDFLPCLQIGETLTITQESGKVPVAKYVSINEISCVLPKLQSAQVSISNDGVNPSYQKTTHVVYDSECHDCTVSNTTFDSNCERTVCKLVVVWVLIIYMNISFINILLILIHIFLSNIFLFICILKHIIIYQIYYFLCVIVSCVKKGRLSIFVCVVE